MEHLTGEVMSRWYTGDEKVDTYVEDIIVSGITIEGGDGYGIPSWYQNFIYDPERTGEKYLVVSGTSLGDGVLGPGESVALEHIISWTDTCRDDFEVGIAAGIALAAIATVTFPVDSLPYWVCMLAAGMSASLSYGESETIFVAGGLKNAGVYPVKVYMRVSKFKFRKDTPPWCIGCGPCYYNADIGILFRVTDA